jgi:hypothetical protein
VTKFQVVSFQLAEKRVKKRLFHAPPNHSSFSRSFVFIRGLKSSLLYFAFTPWYGTNAGTGRKFPKKVLVPTYSAFVCAVKARRIQGFKVQVGSSKK